MTLLTIRQSPKETVQDYNNQFHLLLKEVTRNLVKSKESDIYQGMYIKGLTPDLKKLVNGTMPMMLREVMDRAIAYVINEEYAPIEGPMVAETPPAKKEELRLSPGTL